MNASTAAEGRAQTGVMNGNNGVKPGIGVMPEVNFFQAGALEFIEHKLSPPLSDRLGQVQENRRRGVEARPLRFNHASGITDTVV